MAQPRDVDDVSEEVNGNDRLGFRREGVADLFYIDQEGIAADVDENRLGACRDDGRFPVGIIGDGDYLMATGAVWTAVHYRVPLLMVINNNTSWYNDEEHQANIAAIRKRPPENAYIGTTTRDPDVDLAKNAESHGAVAIGPIAEPGDLAPAFKRTVKVVEDGGVDVRTSNL